MQNAFSCPIDQLHVSGLLGCEGVEMGLQEKLSDIRYIAAKRLKTCDDAEFLRVSDTFYHQKDLVYRIVRGGAIPPQMEVWIPTLRDALDSAAIHWGIKFDEETDDETRGLDEWGVGVIPDPVIPDPEFDDMERNAINPRGSLYANA